MSDGRPTLSSVDKQNHRFSRPMSPQTGWTRRLTLTDPIYTITPIDIRRPDGRIPASGRPGPSFRRALRPAGQPLVLWEAGAVGSRSAQARGC